MTERQKTIHPLRSQYKQSSFSSTNTFVQILQRQAGVRSATYLMGAAALLRTVSYLYNPDFSWVPYARSITITPFGYAWTYAFVKLREEDTVRWGRVPLLLGTVQAGTGIVLGTSAFLLVMGTAASRGWVYLPSWGWEQDAPTVVIRSMFLLVASTLATAWNEEMVFRGYGLDVTSAAIGRPAAAIGLTALFARGHGSDIHMVVGQGALGLALLMLRLRTDSLWVPVGYHFAWNYIQTAIFGSPDGLPSLRPLHVTGPATWLGRPGFPEPGLLSTIVHLTIATITTWQWWRSRSSRNKT